MCVCVTVPVGKDTLGIEKILSVPYTYLFDKNREKDNGRLTLVKTWKSLEKRGNWHFLARGVHA